MADLWPTRSRSRSQSCATSSSSSRPVLRLHVLCGSGKTHNLRLVATGRADDRRTKLRRKLSKGWQPLKGCQKKTEANYVCLMRKGSKLSSPSPSLSLFVVWGVKLICRCTMWATQCCGKYLYLCLCLCLACLMWREFNILTSDAGYQICLLLLHITHNWMGKVIARDCISGTTWRIINIPLSSFPSTNWSKNDHNNHYYSYISLAKAKAKALEVDPCVWSQVGKVEGSFPLIRNWWLPISLTKQSNLRT